MGFMIGMVTPFKTFTETISSPNVDKIKCEFTAHFISVMNARFARDDVKLIQLGQGDQLRF